MMEEEIGEWGLRIGNEMRGPSLVQTFLAKALCLNDESREGIAYATCSDAAKI